MMAPHLPFNQLGKNNPVRAIFCRIDNRINSTRNRDFSICIGEFDLLDLTGEVLMRDLWIPFVATMILFVGSPLASHAEEKQKDAKQQASVWMKTKTEFSKNILVGLTEADFAKVEANAKALNAANYLEILFRPSSPEYTQQIALFITANQELIRQAKGKNVYGATLAYNQMTVSCVQCHQVIRDAKK
jgi:hypothetical protein